MSRFKEHFTDKRNQDKDKQFKESQRTPKVSEEDRIVKEMRRENGVNKRLQKILIGR